ncbi:MAG: Hsp20/alpha crystallin family protein [Nanoarchaeota archaeon]|nr:Hsp20/alpha crystallin family protein [Nanoarchaeota archaeon]MCG2717503.1 Hsp20/alpha crystallin family protein [Nanoarchaeota archaeon]
MESESIKELSEFVPEKVRWKILSLLPEKKGLDIDKDMPRILTLSLQKYPETKGIIKEKVLNKLKNLCLNLNILEEENKLSQFMNSLDEKSKTTLIYLWEKRHANIRDLSKLIHSQTDHQTLTRIKEVINPLSQNILGKPALEFKESKIDPITGEKKMFNWWVAEDIYPARGDEMLDIFNEKEHLKIITEVPNENVNLSIDNDILTISGDNYSKKIPLFYSVEKGIKKTCKNNILEIKIKKRGE